MKCFVNKHNFCLLHRYMENKSIWQRYLIICFLANSLYLFDYNLHTKEMRTRLFKVTKYSILCVFLILEKVDSRQACFGL